MVSRSGVVAVALVASCFSLAAQSRQATTSAQQPSVKLQPGESAVPGQCLTQQEIDLNRGLLALTRPTRGVENQQNADDPPHFDPQYLVGTWTIDGVLPDSPLGPAGDVTGVDTVRHLRDCTYESVLQMKGAATYTVKTQMVYDRHAGYLVRVEQDSRGFQMLKTGTVGGDAGGYFSHHWQTAEIAHKGARVRLTGTSFFASPENYRVRMQIAVNDQPFVSYGTLWWRRQGAGATP